MVERKGNFHISKKEYWKAAEIFLAELYMKLPRVPEYVKALSQLFLNRNPKANTGDRISETLRRVSFIKMALNTQ